MPNERVLGVDACKTGWVGVVLAGERISVHAAPAIDELVDAVAANGPLAVIAIDMPIGLPDHGSRLADSLARSVVGGLRSSVFATPVRAALDEPDHHAASARHRTLAGAGITFTGELGDAGRRAGPDDVLDAAVAAWTTRRVARGEATARPDPPEVFSDGWPAAIWS